MRQRMAAGDIDSTLPASGTLTADQKQQLAAMAEEEKLAHDVYTVLGERTGDARFTRIAASEQQHLTAVRVLLTRYGVTDPTQGRDAGEFASAATTKAYSAYVSKGSASLEAALGVGRTIESADIADLKAAVKGLDASGRQHRLRPARHRVEPPPGGLQPLSERRRPRLSAPGPPSRVRSEAPPSQHQGVGGRDDGEGHAPGRSARGGEHRTGAREQAELDDQPGWVGQATP